jgi:hypothetical protein
VGALFEGRGLSVAELERRTEYQNRFDGDISRAQISCTYASIGETNASTHVRQSRIDAAIRVRSVQQEEIPIGVHLDEGGLVTVHNVENTESKTIAIPTVFAPHVDTDEVCVCVCVLAVVLVLPTELILGTQRQIFERSCKRMLRAAMCGSRCAVIAYGITGSGKSCASVFSPRTV